MIVTWIILAAITILIGNLVVHGLLLWLTCQVCRAAREPSAKPTFLRSMAIALLLAILNMALLLGFGYAAGMLSPELRQGVMLLSGVIGLVAIPFAIGLVMRLPIGKTLLVSVIWFVLISVPGLGEYFALRTFIAEAFIIPTGGMAETLNGYHKEVTCPECGVVFRVNASGEVEKTPPDVIEGCVCPNCRYQLKGQEMPAGHSGGDRILVTKLLTDKLLGPQHRFEVVVFDYPDTADQKQGKADYFKQIKRLVGRQGEPADRDAEPMKYVKRLVGLPGETIGIHYGKLYVLDPGEGLKYDEGLTKPEDLRRREHMHEDDETAVDWLKKRQKFTIVRKTPAQIDTLKHLVYDNDHPAKDAKSPRWQPQDAMSWESSPPLGFKSSSKAHEQVSWIGYRHTLRDGNDKPQLITDFSGYNSYLTQGNPGFAGRIPHTHPTMNWVGDLILDCEVTVQRAEGKLLLELRKGMARFQATWDLTNGECTLSRETVISIVTLDNKATELTRGTHHVRFANVDDRLVVWVDKSLPFGDGVPYEPAKERGPTQSADLYPANIGVQGSAVVSVHKLKLWRDTYYSLEPGRPDAERVDWSDPQDWDRLRDLPAKTFYVQPGHYFCLGDNSMESSDSRQWGLVPERLMIGRALMVYYPFSRFGAVK